MAHKHLINRQITLPSLTVIDPDGVKHGPLSRHAAYDLAAQRGLDLVQMSVDPPIAKLMDYGKFLFEEKKKLKDRSNSPEVKRKQAFTELKEITLSYCIADHDFQVVVDKASRFLEKGHRVKCTIRLRGREQRHHERAAEVLNRLAQEVAQHGRPEKPPYPESTRIILNLVPNA